MEYHKPEDIKQPVQGLFLEEEEIGAHPVEMFGADGTVDIGAHIASFFEQQNIKGVPIVPLFPNHDCSDFLENKDLQRNGLFDPYDCVTCSRQSGIDISEKAQFNRLSKQSRKFTAVDSGTIPGRGNSNSAVQKSIKNTGMVAESDCPSINETTTQAQFFAKSTADIYSKEDFKTSYDVWFIPLPTRDGISVSRAVLWDALVYGAIGLTVSGRYSFDKNGWVIRTEPNDSHDVLMTAMSKDATSFDDIGDSENPGGFTKFSPTYDYHYPYLIYVTKKVMPTFKLNGGPAIVALCADGIYRPFENGNDYHEIIGAYNQAGNISTLDADKGKPGYVDPALVHLDEVISIKVGKTGGETVTVPPAEHVNSIVSFLQSLFK